MSWFTFRSVIHFELILVKGVGLSLDSFFIQLFIFTEVTLVNNTI